MVVLDFLTVDNFDFTRKIVKKIWGEKLVKCWGFVKIEFLDKNLTFRIVCNFGMVNWHAEVVIEIGVHSKTRTYVLLSGLGHDWSELTSGPLKVIL